MQKSMPLAQFTVNLEWCASEAHTRGELLLRGHGANRVKYEGILKFFSAKTFQNDFCKTLYLRKYWPL